MTDPVNASASAVPEVNIDLVCGDCVHCQPGPRTHEDIFSRVCYRYPPVAIGGMTAQGLAIVSVRPEIRPDTFACGEYEPEDEPT